MSKARLLLCTLAAAHALRDDGTWATPGGASFDCAMRKLAYAYGKQLLPQRGAFNELYEALGLNADPNCTTALAAAADATAPGAERAADALPPGAVYVDAARGDDGAAGDAARPLRTVQAAADRAGRGGTVVLRSSATHFLAAPLRLGPQHSGLALRAHPDDPTPPVVSGGANLSASWEPYDIGVAGANVYRASLAGQGVSAVPGLQIDGARATRARYPNLDGGIEVTPGYGGMVSGADADWTPPQFDRFGNATYFTDADPAHTRNNTPDDWFQHYMIGIGGLCSVYEPPVSYWCSEDPSGGGAFAFRTPSGVTPKRGALPHSPYADVSQAVFNVWRPARWANWMFEVGAYDAAANNFTFGRGGFQGARGEDAGGDFFVENVFEELDHPGEFFFNESTLELFLWHNGTGPPPPTAELVAPQLQVLLNVTGTQWDPVANVSVDGVTFRAAAYTYLEPHGVPSAGDWALERLGAVFLQGTEGTTLSRCAFERLDGHALMISGYNRDVTVADSEFAYVGGSAVASWGFTNETEGDNHPAAGVDGTDGNHPEGTKVLRNLAREVGLYEKQNSFYVQAKTARATIEGNVFFNGPRAGINFNDGFGGGDVIARNLVFSTCRESGDHGPFNSWDRQPFLTTVRTGEPSMIMAWREIHHNFFVDNYSPQENVDNDDGSGYFRTHDNFLVYGAQGMKNDFGGHDNHHYANVYAYAGQALGVCEQLDGHEDYFYGNKVVLTGGSVGGVQCAAPGKTVLSDNAYYTPTGAITECDANLTDWQALGNDAGSTVARLPDDDTIIGWAVELLDIAT